MKTAVIYDKWLHQFGGAEVVAVTMAEILLKCGWKVTFISGQNVNPSKIKEKLSIDLEKVEFHTVWNDEDRLKRIVEDKDLFINLSFMDYGYAYAKKNIYYTHFPTPIRNFLFNATLAFFKATGLHALLPTNLRQRISDRTRAGIFFDMSKRLSSYDVILANSKYTKKWIKNYWNMDSQVLYPPINIVDSRLRGNDNQNHGKDLKLSSSGLTRGSRNNWITSIGRFFTLGHGKKQEILIDAFKKLTSLADIDWQLHLIGGLGGEASSIKFMKQLKTMAKGYPIYFHINVNHNEVGNVLSQSKIYWHATGFGENEDKNPMAFEHFGIAPVEAIGAGCIPLLYNGGGLPEIIEKVGLQKEKYLFNTIGDLVEKTLAISPDTIKPINFFSVTQFATDFKRYIL